MKGGLLIITLLTDVIFRYSLILWKAVPSSTAGRRRRAWSESDDDELLQRQPLSRENSAELQQSDEEVTEDGHKPNGNAASEDED